MQHILEAGCVPIAARLIHRQLQQRARKSTLGRNGKGSSPPGRPCELRGPAQQAGIRPSLALREEADELKRLVAPAPSNFQGDNNQTATAATEELNILGFLARTRHLKLNAILVRSTLLGTTVSTDRRHERSVDSKLCAAPKRQAVGDHLELTTIPRGNTLQIHVPEEHVLRYSGPGLTANASESFFQRKGSPSDNTASRTSSPVIARLVQRSPAATAPGYQGKR
jgi:hypothetical protein